MSLYTKDSIERVREAIDMVELVGARSDLRRVGSRWTGLCPFHDERTPSFSVNADHKLYHCFGCGASGDAFDFVQELESLSFKEAVEQLADRYGVELKREQEDPEAEDRRRKRDRLLTLLDRVAAYYERVLWESPEAARAREYLAGRGLEESVLRKFRVGYSPSAWDTVLLAAQSQGFSQEELIATGLAQRGRNGGVYDRFRARVMFPLADARGKVLGFGARALRDEQKPKYVNTSENEIYKKGQQLFGIDLARAVASKRGRVVAVEGYTDVLALHQAGIAETVAIMGTALTDDQVRQLRKTAGTVYMALDADRAGQEAMLRAARVAEDSGLELLVVDMPEGRDPAEVIAGDGPDAFHRLLDEARVVADFEIRRKLRMASLDTLAGRRRARDEILPVLRNVRDRATRAELVRYVADRLEVDPEILMAQDPPSAAAAEPQRAPGRLAGFDGQLDAVARSERTFLSMCVASELGREYAERLRPDHFSIEPLRLVRAHLLEHWDDPLAGLPEEDPGLSALIKDVVMRADDEDVSADVLRLTFLQLEFRRVERGLRHAEQDSDFDAQRALATERQGLRDQIDELMGLTL
ncbi:MAG: primase [Thermoleophilaceae bacterium]|jgi:DNA primase|nr:primase [Thermoleophilaceae bacterium]